MRLCIQFERSGSRLLWCFGIANTVLRASRINIGVSSSGYVFLHPIQADGMKTPG